MHSFPHLYNLLRSMFRSVFWCETLYQCSKSHENAHAFGQELISAAASQELFFKIHRSQIFFSHSTQPSTSSAGPSNFSHLAFFSKTPAPLSHLRPLRFQNGQNFNHGCHADTRKLNFKRPRRPHSIRPSGLFNYRFRRPRLWYGCCQLSHLPRIVLQCPRHIARFQQHFNSDDSAKCIYNM